ncbi:hypothetical protein Sjap_007196 [Stephania japonica]|uniref:RNA polymerase II subunit B1 CTD phosphatase RPAP2 homolog n=1 Tax=Stephania japonica TaxID=461633 RepID=A0AAP0JM98_9MAGN
MAKEQFISVNEAVLKIQLALLKGIHEESQLFAAGSLLSRSDYEDVVTERSIVKRCGYPLCENRLAEERASRGRYRISLKEHKVYDLHETYMYCSSRCVIESRAFGGSLEEKRVGVLNSPKIGEVLKLFEELGLDKREELRERGGLGVKELKELKIEENVNVRGGEVLLEDWLGPPNAIEGYVPNLDTRLKAPTGEHGEEGLEPNKGKLKKGKGKNKGVNEMDFTSAIIVGDQFGVPKFSYGSEESYTKKKMKESKQNQFSIHEAPVPVQNSHHMQLKESNTEVNNSASKDQVGVVGTCSGSTQSVSDSSIERSKGMTLPNKTTLKSALKHSDARRLSRSVTWADEKEVSDISIANLNKTTLKPALKHSGVRRFSQIVNWADEKEVSDISIANLNNVQQIACISYGSESSSSSSTVGGIDGRPRLASDAKTELTPSQAAEAVNDGQGYTKKSDSGIIMLPQLHDYDEQESQEEDNVLELEEVPLNLPNQPDLFNSKLFDPQKSWYDAPPNGFNLNLSSFATMWTALFGWITSSSLAYIYGQDVSSHEEFMSINGKEYPRKILSSDGRSSEIKESLAGILARVVPELAAELRLRAPLSALEHGMECLLNTMSFMDRLPSLETEQWHVLTLVFIDALSVCRIPALAPQMTSMRVLLDKVLGSAQVTWEEYESMKDIIIPLGRRPQFSTQSGG